MGLGSNVGDSRSILAAAVSELSLILDGFRGSSVYLTEPQGGVEQKCFLNMVVSGFYGGTPHSLLEKAQAIETAHGRDRMSEIKNGPRTLDIDILIFGDEVIRENDLIVPHERMKDRQFSLIPLLEIEGDCRDPDGVFYRDYLKRLPDQGVRKAGSIYGN